VQREQVTRAGAKPPIRAKQGKGNADAHGAQGRFLRASPARAAKGRVGSGPIGQQRFGLVQVIARGITRYGLSKLEQGRETMGFPKAANIRAGAGQDIQRMGLAVKGPMPIVRRYGQCGSFRQERTARGRTIRQSAMGKTRNQAQAMPSKQQDGARAEPPRRIGAKPNAPPSGRGRR